jgi:hypothetical protein
VLDFENGIFSYSTEKGKHMRKVIPVRVRTQALLHLGYYWSRRHHKYNFQIERLDS